MIGGYKEVDQAERQHGTTFQPWHSRADTLDSSRLRNARVESLSQPRSLKAFDYFAFLPHIVSSILHLKLLLTIFELNVCDAFKTITANTYIAETGQTE
jgi:hypothetical protein